MTKLKEGRDEPIIDPDIPIIDTHHHLFDRPALRYLLDDYLEDVATGHRIVASVYVETLAMARPDGPEAMRPVGEVEFANGMAAMSASGVYGPCRVAAAIVGYADLRLGARVGETLDRSMSAAPDRFRGVRQITMEHPDPNVLSFLTHRPPPGLMTHPQFRNGLAELAPRGLSFDATVFHHQLPALAALADQHPDTLIILDHLGIAVAIDASAQERTEVFRDWQEKLRRIAERPNVVCKIGGLGLAYWGFGFDMSSQKAGYLELSAAWRPYVETAIEAFGTSRCMMESDYPPDGRSCGFVPLWNALKHVVRDASNEEKADLFHRTAARVYRI